MIALSPYSSPRSLRDSAERLHHDSSAAEAFRGASVFFLGWSLHADSLFSVHSAALEFTQHALPPTTIEDMDAMNNVTLSHNLDYVAA